eukprot:CAMPEP_0185610378 /NCGR_PEP_ID=MMETSP0436-20130131/12164_1 /TAXON_ID=626734 ORGANISM="Favella taraikaensis, Strain Fe Narragansett Bay" /NCGR_SAMPLE_ID=MMETSP0436 /ASSEMBLY_ACC=CAM_ASM_000390 /LENGTH=161 /DNA_ID=CAMNT_0028242987 /DNA_START=605 /DNA_END=1090 /DNA_ORIENTATION=-
MNTLNLDLVLGLVVEAQRHARATAAQNAAGVARICHEKLLRIVVDHHDVSCATDRVELPSSSSSSSSPFTAADIAAFFLFVTSVKILSKGDFAGGVVLAHLANLFKTALDQRLVDSKEAFAHALADVTALLELLDALEEPLVVALDVLGDLAAAVSIEHAI